MNNVIIIYIKVHIFVILSMDEYVIAIFVFPFFVPLFCRESNKNTNVVMFRTNACYQFSVASSP